MNKLKSSIIKYWYYYIAGIVILAEILVFAIFNDECYIQVHDNLDLFMPHYQVMTAGKLWYAHNVEAPILGGISRDLLGSEFLLYNALYIIFPGIAAYIIGYFLKIAIGMSSFILLAREIYAERYECVKPYAVLIGLAFGLIPVFPTYGIAFTSVPLIILLIRVLYRKQSEPLKNRLILYVGVFCYPILSYFSYIGFFILCYICIAVIALWIRDKKFPKTTFASVCVLSLGYIAFEYRLFAAMLLDDTVTIRTTMARSNNTLAEAIRLGFEEFVLSYFHSQDSHTYVILPVVLIGLILIGIGYIRRKDYRGLFVSPAFLGFYVILFNMFTYILCSCGSFVDILEALIPQLTGFDFTRVSFLNPFLWYAEVFIVIVSLADSRWRFGRVLSQVLAVLSLFTVMLVPQTYNDFYYTVYNQSYKLIKQQETSTVNYREFYSTDLFESIKRKVGYSGEWSVAYGLHPGVLDYNGISTLDGYLGMYSQEYKDKWAEILSPALAGSPSLKEYFDTWGARLYVYSGSDENTYAPLRNPELADTSLAIDVSALANIGCRYIFSRVKFSNEEELPITLVGIYTAMDSPYTIYLYSLQ